MLNIAIMDSDTYVKKGVAHFFKSDMTRILSTSNIGDLTINLQYDDIDVVVMELFSRDDNIFDCIEFIRNFPARWPNCKLVVYTQIMNPETTKLLVSVTGQKDVVLKTNPITRLVECVFSPWKGNVLQYGMVG